VEIRRGGNIEGEAILHWCRVKLEEKWWSLDVGVKLEVKGGA